VLAAAGCGSSAPPAAKLPEPRGPLIKVAVSQLPTKRRLGNVVFVRVDPHRALRLFRRGQLDVAPVPLGDLQRVLRDPALKQAVRVRRLNAIDLVVAVPGGALARSADLRRTYSETADRADYQALVPELEAPAAETLAPSAHPNARAAAVAFSRARKQISRLPHVAVRFGVPRDPTLAYGAGILVAAWRDLGLGAYLGKGRPDARFERVFDPKPRPGRPVIPVAWAVDAHLVSRRVRGWRENDRGVVDYSRLKFLARRRFR
jgi:hypothetical protein